MTVRRKVCPTFQLEGSHTLTPVSPIEESESLSQSGETEKADEGEKEAEVSKDAMEEEEEEEEESSDGRRSVGRLSPKGPTKVEKEEHERTHCPYRSWCEHCVRARARNSHHRRQEGRCRRNRWRRRKCPECTSTTSS